MKKYLTLALAATLFAACSNDSDPVSQSQDIKKNSTEVANVPVTFGAYVDRATTRAGLTGDITAATLQTGKFGVFAYYTDNNNYDGLTAPNFMYNQEVSWDATNNVWTYAPLKYWPNEYGSNAVSEDVDRVSFFAYAPYVAVTPSSGKATTNADWGITGLSRNSATGDPFVKYVVSFDKAKAVDLVWGVNDGTTTWNIIQTNKAQTFTAGLPWLDVQRPADATASQLLKFTFKHALSRLNVQVDAIVDSNKLGTERDSKTRIFVRSITFEGFAMKGALSLNNTTANTPVWLNYDGCNDLDSGDEVTIYDGRKDGKEGTSAAGSEKTTGLNPVLIQDTDWGVTAMQAGVTMTPVNLFSNTTAATDGFYVIPTTDDVKVSIVYDVETEDANLNTYLSDGKTHGSSIENKITQNITFGSGTTATSKLEAGKSYTIGLHLGMNSVKFDADVTAWPTTTEDGGADLPANN